MSQHDQPDQDNPTPPPQGGDSGGGGGSGGSSGDAPKPHGSGRGGIPVSVRNTDNPQPRPILDSPQAQVDQAVDDAVSQVQGGIREKITAAIKQVYDPEIPVDIHELGLIYEVNIDPDNNVQVVMTLTSPNCPAAQELPVSVRRAVSRVPEVKDVEVDIVFDPPWTPEKMSDIAKITLGMM